MQKDSEAVTDYIQQLQCMFQIGLAVIKCLWKHKMHCYMANYRVALSKAPAVSGACDYEELCIATKNEKRRLIVLE